MASAMETAAQKVLEEKTDIISSSEVSEDLRKPSVPEIQKDQSSPSSTELSEKDLQNLYDIFRYVASAFTKEEFSTRLRDSYPVWEVISSHLILAKRPSKAPRDESPDDIGDWWKYIPDPKQPAKSPLEEPAVHVDVSSRYLPYEKRSTESPRKFIDDDDVEFIPKGKSYPRRKIIQYRVFAHPTIIELFFSDQLPLLVDFTVFCRQSMTFHPSKLGLTQTIADLDIKSDNSVFAQLFVD
ncbi:unnamed protein product [Cylicostephanus goldi]|uniref:Uncharacterized protein n=1 Tax=Cylicostephanus goldi TaxID=71465 RepID=A0A3P7N9A4_CYLGO|nr:unnamed protein product [Cylicostephanus goldi]